MREYITFEELKNLVYDFHKIQKEKERLNKVEHSGMELIRLTFQENDINDEFKIHHNKFTTSALEFQFELRKVLSKHLKIQNENIAMLTHFKPIKFEKNFNYHIKLLLEIKTNNETETSELADMIIISKKEITEYQFSHDLYEISLLSILLNSNLKYKKQIFNACFNIIEKQFENCLYK